MRWEVGLREGAASHEERAARLFEATTGDGFWDVVSGEIGGIFGATPNLVIRHDLLTRTRRIEHSSNVEPVAERVLTQTVGATIDAMGAATRDQLLRSAGTVHVRTNLMRGQARGHVPVDGAAPRQSVWAIIESRETEAILLVVLCAADRPPTEPALERLRSLLPHTRRALTMRLTHGRDRQLQHAAMAALDRMPVGVAVTDAVATILAANLLAKAIIGANDGLASPQGRLSAGVNGPGDRLRALIGAAATATYQGGIAAGGFVLIPRRDKHPLSVTVTPVNGMAADGSILSHGGRPSAVVYMTDPERLLQPDEDSLRALYGLTPAEARLAARLATGESVADIAASLDISYNTARTHLRRIFGKTQTERQGELVSLLVSAGTQLHRVS